MGSLEQVHEKKNFFFCMNHEDVYGHAGECTQITFRKTCCTGVHSPICKRGHICEKYKPMMLIREQASCILNMKDALDHEQQILLVDEYVFYLMFLQVRITLLWDLIVLGWKVNTIIIQKGMKMGAQEEPIRNSFKNSKPGEVVLTTENSSFKKVLFQYKTKSS